MSYIELWNDIVDRVLPVMSWYRANLASMATVRKPDGTLLCEADLTVQELVIDILHHYDPCAQIVAEESANTLTEADASGRVWVVDPIDGSSQFVDPQLTEFCSVVAVLEAGDPVACMILAPELGTGRAPVLLTWNGDGQPPLLCGEPAKPARRTSLVSATRSSRDPATPVEVLAVRAGLKPKTRATSQSLDMARATIDLELDTGLKSFRWFAAARQLLWDSVAGMALAKATGRMVVDIFGNSIIPVDSSIISNSTPTVPTTLVAVPDDIDWILAHLAANPGWDDGQKS